MVPLDGSKLAECVLPHVETFIKGFPVRDVLLVRVLEPVKPDLRVYDNVFDEEFIRQAQKIWKDLEKQEKTTAQGYLDQVAESFKQKKTPVRTQVLIGDVAKDLAEFAESNDVDLIIMASHGHSGIKRWIMGSVTEKLFRTASVPVFIVKAPGFKGAMQRS
jgi:nucleotide-binding universal stress UspA family protein